MREWLAKAPAAEVDRIVAHSDLVKKLAVAE